IRNDDPKMKPLIAPQDSGEPVHLARYEAYARSQFAQQARNRLGASIRVHQTLDDLPKREDQDGGQILDERSMPHTDAERMGYVVRNVAQHPIIDLDDDIRNPNVSGWTNL